MSEPAFWANGKKYAFNMELGNVRGKMPSHGLLVNSPLWQVTEVAADAKSAHVTSRLEFWKYPDLVAQWPFAHEYEMTYSLADGVLEVKTTIANLSAERDAGGHRLSLVLSNPGHPARRVGGAFPCPHPRDSRRAQYPDRRDAAARYSQPAAASRRTLDDGFTDLERDADGRAHFWIESGGKKVETLFGPKYPVATIWLPNGPGGQPREFICFEPSDTIINGVNLAHEGKWSGLQTLGPGEKWTESFWVRASGI